MDTSRRLASLVFTLLGILAAATLAAQSSDWAGRYDSPHGVALELASGTGSGYTGTLTVDGQDFPIELSGGPGGLTGSFTSHGASFPVNVATGEEPGQIVVTSEGSMFELSKAATRANPLARKAAPANPLSRAPTGQTPAGTPPAASTALRGNFRHPDGYFSMNLPPDWEASMMDDDVFELITGIPGDLVIVLLGELEAGEIGRTSAELMATAHEAVDAFLAQNAGIQADSSRASVSPAMVGKLTGATSVRPAIDQGSSATIWQGLVTDGAAAFMLIASLRQRGTAHPGARVRIRVGPSRAQLGGGRVQPGGNQWLGQIRGVQWQSPECRRVDGSGRCHPDDPGRRVLV